MTLISHLVAKEAKLPEKTGLGRNARVGEAGLSTEVYWQLIRDKGHFVSILHTIDLIFLYW